MTHRNERGERPGRVVVGVQLTLSGLQALRVAVAEARRRRTTLNALRAWGPGPIEPPAQPPTTAAGLTGALGMGPPGGQSEQADARRGALAAEAEAVVAHAFAETMGGEPADLVVRTVVAPETAGRLLVEYACREEDLLVVGSTDRRGRLSQLRRPRGSPVVRYCLRHAVCPVLVVPPPPLTRVGSPRSLLRQLRREIDEFTDSG